jgi:hypothetical protein
MTYKYKKQKELLKTPDLDLGIGYALHTEEQNGDPMITLVPVKK